MVNYFEVTNRMDEYEKMSDYEHGFIDGIFSISNKIDNDYRPFLADSLAEYIEDYLEKNKDCPPSGCDSLEECAEIFTYDFLMYYEEMAMDLLKKNYIVHLASFLEIDLTDDPEMLFYCTGYQQVEARYAKELMFYNSTRIRLYSKFNDYQKGYLEAYQYMFSILDMNIKTHLETDNEFAIDAIKMQILDVLNGNVNIPIEPGTPIFLPVLEAVYPILMANDLMEYCMEHIYDKCMNEYMYYVSEFTGIDYDDILFTVMNG